MLRQGEEGNARLLRTGLLGLLEQFSRPFAIKLHAARTGLLIIRHGKRPLYPEEYGMEPSRINASAFEGFHHN